MRTAHIDWYKIENSLNDKEIERGFIIPKGLVPNEGEKLMCNKGTKAFLDLRLIEMLIDIYDDKEQESKSQKGIIYNYLTKSIYLQNRQLKEKDEEIEELKYKIEELQYKIEQIREETNTSYSSSRNQESVDVGVARDYKQYVDTIAQLQQHQQQQQHHHQNVLIKVVSVYDCLSSNIRSRFELESIGKNADKYSNEELLNYLITTRVPKENSNLNLCKESPIYLYFDGNAAQPTISKWLERVKSELAKKGGAHFFDYPEGSLSSKALGEYLMRGIQPPELLAEVKSYLGDKLDNLSWQVIRDSIITSLDKLGDFINRPVKKLKRFGNQKDKKFRLSNNHDDKLPLNINRVTSKANQETTISQSNNLNNKQQHQQQQPKKRIDPSTAPKTIDISLTQSNGVCIRCKSNSHKLMDCQIATDEEKQWWKSWTKQIFTDFRKQKKKEKKRSKLE